MSVPEMLNSLVEFHGKNDQPRKNLDKLTIYFFLKTVLWAFYMVNRVSLYLLGKHKQTCFIIPYSICSFLSSFSLSVFIKLRKLSKFYYLRGNCSRANYPGSNNSGHFSWGEGNFPREQLSGHHLYKEFYSLWTLWKIIADLATWSFTDVSETW